DVETAEDEQAQRIVGLDENGCFGDAFALGVVFICGLIAFVAGVGVSDREGVAEASIFVQAYYALGLFVLGGLDVGVPTGGPTWARTMLWLAYFAAPAITASALVEGILRAIGARGFQFRRPKQHIIIAGYGKLAELYLAKLRRHFPHKPVWIIERDRDRLTPEAAQELYGAALIYGDINSDALLNRLYVERAERLLLLTGDDFVNLDTAARVMQRFVGVEGRVVVHVSDLHFMRAVEATHITDVATVFNTHQIAAEYLVRTKLLAHFERTQHLDTVVIAGFGRFGQTVLDELQQHALDRFERVILIDLDCRRKSRIFEEEVGFRNGYRREIVDGDLRDPELWATLRTTFGEEPVFVIGSGDDGTNLHTGLWLRQRYPDAYVVARSFRRSAFAAEVSQRDHFEVFSVADLVENSFPEHWFD
ncbi:MAG: NAD-binding protein, partial [Myxococcota bacterium]